MHRLSERVSRIEAQRKPITNARINVVEWMAGETPEQAVTRAAPTRPFFLLPAPYATMGE